MAPSRWTHFLGGGNKDSEKAQPLVPDSNAPDTPQSSYSPYAPSYLPISGALRNQGICCKIPTPWWDLLKAGNIF